MARRQRTHRSPAPLREFVRRAIERAGSQERLAARLSQGGFTATRRMVGGWATGETMPSAEAIFAIVRTTGLSFDQLAMTDEDQRSLRERLEDLAQVVAALQAQVEALTAWGEHVRRRLPVVPSPPSISPSAQELIETQRRLLSRARGTVVPSAHESPSAPKQGTRS
jgi:acetylornithine deacetylase/succinyl-diaminopimelate desuccinylase-like protein